MSFNIALLLLFVSKSHEACDIGGTWSTWQWGPDQIGFDHCGSCWNVTWIRQCLSLPNCPCTGRAIFANEVNNDVCVYPRPPCCAPNRKTLIDGFPVCTTSNPLPPDPTPVNGYCPESGTGVWGQWGDWTSCSATCGMAGMRNRTRTCVSESYGCPCRTSDIGPCQMLHCPANPCPGSQPCLNSSRLVSDGITPVCNPYPTLTPTVTDPCNPSYTPWINSTGAVCSDNCGMCGTIKQYRYDYPSNEIIEAYNPCGLELCPFPRKSCCPGYVKKICNNGTYYACVKP